MKRAFSLLLAFSLCLFSMGATSSEKVPHYPHYFEGSYYYYDIERELELLKVDQASLLMRYCWYMWFLTGTVPIDEPNIYYNNLDNRICYEMQNFTIEVDGDSDPTKSTVQRIVYTFPDDKIEEFHPETVALILAFCGPIPLGLANLEKEEMLELAIEQYDIILDTYKNPSKPRRGLNLKVEKMENGRYQMELFID